MWMSLGLETDYLEWLKIKLVQFSKQSDTSFSTGDNESISHMLWDTWKCISESLVHYLSSQGIPNEPRSHRQGMIDPPIAVDHDIFRLLILFIR